MATLLVVGEWRCDGRCHGAERRTCACICHGRYHGLGTGEARVAMLADLVDGQYDGGGGLASLGRYVVSEACQPALF